MTLDVCSDLFDSDVDLVSAAMDEARVDARDMKCGIFAGFRICGECEKPP